MFYVYNKISGEVHLWDFEEEQIEWDCAKNLDIFFECMCEVMKTKIIRIKSEDFSIDEFYLNSVFENCLKLNDDDLKYSTFYEHILGIED